MWWHGDKTFFFVYLILQLKRLQERWIRPRACVPHPIHTKRKATKMNVFLETQREREMENELKRVRIQLHDCIYLFHFSPHNSTLWIMYLYPHLKLNTIEWKLIWIFNACTHMTNLATSNWKRRNAKDSSAHSSIAWILCTFFGHLWGIDYHVIWTQLSFVPWNSRNRSDSHWRWFQFTSVILSALW